MALTFNTDIEMENGITISNAYGRVAVLDNIGGYALQQAVEIFISEQAFLDGKKPLSVDGLQTSIDTKYDRATDGTDVLALAHTNLQTYLATLGYTTTISL